MDDTHLFKTTFYFLFCIMLVNSAFELPLIPRDNDCPAVVQDGKEIPQQVTYRIDQKRSFDKPGSKSHLVKKKQCEIGLHRSSLIFPKHWPSDCADIQALGGKTSGIYGIYPAGDGNPFNVFCDMDTDGGGWTVFQRRKDGLVNFNREWYDYKHGFGTVSAEHWLGNDKLHRLSNQTANELRVELEDFEGRTRYATYDGFSVASESDNYTLTVKRYSGDAGNSLASHSGESFSTRDRDNDDSPHGHCAKYFHGGWWFNDCFASNLNGHYFDEPVSDRRYSSFGIIWNKWLGVRYSLKSSEMKMRPVKSNN